MAQTITYQRGTTTITANNSFSATTDPILLVTAPSTGYSRVIISQLSFRNTSFQQLSNTARPILTIGQDSAGYSHIGGFVVGNTPCGYLSMSQTTGNSHAYNGGGTSGAGSVIAGVDCSRYYDNSSGVNTPFTSQNFSPDLQSVNSGGSFSAVLASQIWAVPNDRICVKFGGTNSSSTYEIVYSFIFITET